MHAPINVYKTDVKDTCGACDTKTMTRVQRGFSIPFRLKNFISGALLIFFASTLMPVWKASSPRNLVENTYMKEYLSEGQ